MIAALESLVSLKRKEYMKNIYSQSWSKDREAYGIGQYDIDLISLLQSMKRSGKVLEVGIGDGFPYANQLAENGYAVFGIDISPTHIDMVKENHPNIKAFIGDAEFLDFEDDYFDIVYCFRSTWYFPDIIKAVSEMIRVIQPGGGGGCLISKIFAVKHIRC
jgi:SAM-dependent methyltransferase